MDGFVTTRRTADGGIDGRLYFGIPNDPELKSMVIEVKGGANVGITVLRQLAGVLENDQALMAGLIYMEPLGDRKTQSFNRFAGEIGDVELLGTPFPRLQLLSVEEILDGKRFNTPLRLDVEPGPRRAVSNWTDEPINCHSDSHCPRGSRSGWRPRPG